MRDGFSKMVMRSVEDLIFRQQDLLTTIADQQKQIAGLKTRLERSEQKLERARWKAGTDLAHADELLGEAAEMIDSRRRWAEHYRVLDEVGS